MEAPAIFHGGSRGTSRRTPRKISMVLPRSSTEIVHFRGVPWSFVEFRGFPWNTTELHEAPFGSHGTLWRSVESYGTPRNSIWPQMEHHGVPWNFMRLPRNSVMFHGASWNSMEFHGIGKECTRLEIRNIFCCTRNDSRSRCVSFAAILTDHDKRGEE